LKAAREPVCWNRPARFAVGDALRMRFAGTFSRPDGRPLAAVMAVLTAGAVLALAQRDLRHPQ
jgi:hypothetical protein